MGPLNLPDRLALDTNCFVYLLEDPRSDRGAYLEQEIFRPAAAGAPTLVTSSLTVAELLVRPYGMGRSDAAASLRSAVLGFPNLSVVDLGLELADAAARLRGETGLGLADAALLATATRHADAFLTNDRRLVDRGADVPVLLLDDLLGGR